MTAFNIKSKYLVIFLVPLLLISSVVVLANTAIFQLHPKELSLGITFDLVFVIPTIYFLLIRKSNIPKTTVVPLFVIGIIVASFIIPKDFQFHLSFIKSWILPIVETTVFFLVAYKVRQLSIAFRKNKSHNLDFYSTLKEVTAQILPQKMSGAIATEIAVIHYGFFNWRKRKLSSNEFSYHKNSGTIALLLVFIFILLIETSVVHVVLQKWSIVAAWILTVLSSYSCLQIFGIMRSMSKRPISIENGELKLRYGLFSESTIALDNIETIELSTKSIEPEDGIHKLSPLGDFESHNVIIRLKEVETLSGLYGLKKEYQNLALFVDQKEDFKDIIEQNISSPHDLKRN